MFERDRPAPWLAPTQLAALVFQFPLIFVASNWRSNASLLSILLIGLVGIGFTLLLYYLLSLRWERWRVLEATSALVLVFWYWDTLADPRGLAIPKAVVGLVVGGLLVAFAARFADHRYLRVAMFVTAATLFMVGLITVARLALTTPASEIEGGPTLELRETSIGRPDIYILIVDGYARADVLLSDYGFSNDEFISKLSAHGLTVVGDAKTNYTATHFSIASLLSLGYVAIPGADVSITDLRKLGNIASGDNALVRSLRNAGYVYIHGSSDWWGNQCGQLVDVCLDTPQIDITTFDLLGQTPAEALLYRATGDPGIAVALKRYEQFKAWEDTTSTWPTGPRLGVFHLLIPHPPLYLDSQCQPRLGDQYAQRRINSYPFLPESLLQLRKSAYVDQVVCTNRIVESFVAAVPDDSALIVMSDHGPDSRGQIALRADLWNDDARRERFGSLLAARIPCPTELHLDPNIVNVGRRLLTCLFDAPLPDLPGRYFVAPSSRAGGPLEEIDDPDG